MRRISLLCPTRARHADAKRLADSVFRTAEHKKRVELLFYVDNDDPQLKQYQEFGAKNEPRVHLTVGEPISVSKSYNIIAERCTGDILIITNDDVIYHTDSWDVLLEKEVDKYPDGVFLMWFNDGTEQRSRHPAFPMVSRRWYETLGYLTPGVFEFWYNDTWLMDIGRKLGRMHYIDHVFAEHRHVKMGKAQRDETHRRNFSDGRIHRDRKVFFDTEQKRVEDAAKLRALMVDHG